MTTTFQHALLESLAAHADQTALESGEKALSFRSVLQKSKAITQKLLDKGVSPNMVVSIQTKDRFQLIPAIIGVINARCCFSVLDSTLPPPRMAQLLESLQPTLHLTTQNEPGLELLVQKSVFIDELDELEAEIEFPVFDPDDALYIYFTSGSTGVPKGIVGKNGSLLQFLNWEIATFHLDANTRGSQLISPFFDAFLRDVFAPLLCGGTVCIPPLEDAWMTPGNLVHWLDTAHITLVHCVPSVFRLFNVPEVTPAHFSQLKHVLLSGEKIIPVELECWFQRFNTRIQLVNLYGATESTMIRAYYLIQAEDALKARIPVGKPIWGTELLVLNAEGNPVKRLMTGDIYIVSNYLSKGYLHNPALNAERFVTVADGKRAFKTGDKGRILADGNLELLGRDDRQIKLNGIRIELDEIETILLKSNLVKQAAVFIHSIESAPDTLIAFVCIPVASSDEPLLEETLLDYLRANLPTYMVPARVILIESFPLLPNGKIDQRTLLERLEANHLVEPVNEIEWRLLAIWKDLLGDKPISTLDSFQSLGGNSIGIMRLIGRIYNEFGIRVALNELFNNLNIKKQALFITEKEKDNQYLIQKVEQRHAYPLSASQERIYFEYQLDPESTNYNLPMTWEIKQNYDKQKLERALLQLIERHEGLRTHFIMEDLHPLQVINPIVQFDIEEHQIHENAIEDAIHDFIRPFDLNKAPLLRIGVLQTTDLRHILVADIHHIVCDGMSQSILLADFAQFYEAVALPPLLVQYKDYAVWEDRFRQSDLYLSQRQFWLQPFEKAIPKLALPTSQSTESYLIEEGGDILFDLPKSALQELLSFLREKDLSTFSGLFALYFFFMSRISGQDDLVLGTLSSGRTQKEIEPVLGMFVKTLPIRQKIDFTLPCATFIEQLHEYLVRAISAQTYDLADIMIELNRNRAGDMVSQLFDVLFVYQNYETGTSSGVEDDIVKYPFEHTDAKYPITLFVEESDLAFHLRWEYSGSFFKRKDSEWLVEQFSTMAIKVSQELFAPIMEAVGSQSLTEVIVEDDISFNF